MGELVAVRGREQHAQLALQKSCRCRCGICSANLGRRLDLLEARVLSHWHEFLVHKSEVQRKFEDVFTKGLRPKGMAAAQHAELERRLGSFEAVVRHSEEAKEVDARHKLELQAFSEETWRGLERLQKRVAQESDSLGKASVDLQRGLAILDKKSDELQLSLQSQVADLRKEMQDGMLRASQELGAELRTSLERRLWQGHAEALDTAEAATHRSVKSAASELSTSVLAAEASAQQQCSRLRGELEVAEIAAQEVWRRSSSEIARAVAASERNFKPQLQQIDREAREATTKLELSLERRLLQHSTEAAESVRDVDARAKQNMAEVTESLTNVELLLRSQRAEALASLEALDSRLNAQSRRCANSEAREASLERRLQQERSQLSNDMRSNMSQLHRELAERTEALESRLISELAALRDELSDTITSGAEGWATRLGEVQQRWSQELESRLASSKEQLARISGSNDSLQEFMLGFKTEVAELRDVQQTMEHSITGLRVKRDSELQLLAEDSRSFKAKLTEEMTDMQSFSRSLAHRVNTVETACAGADRSASSAKAEVLALRQSMETSLDHVQAIKDDLSRELQNKDRAAREAVENAQMESQRVTREELCREHRQLRTEVNEQLQRLTSVERRAKEVARGEEVSAQRLATLSDQVERLARAAQSSCDAGNRELFAELKTAVSRVEELQSQVNRLLRDAKKSADKLEAVLPRLQETERAIERLSRSGNPSGAQILREVQELRSQLAEVRRQSSLTPRADPLSVGNRSCETRRLGWMGEL